MLCLPSYLIYTRMQAPMMEKMMNNTDAILRTFVLELTALPPRPISRQSIDYRSDTGCQRSHLQLAGNGQRLVEIIIVITNYNYLLRNIKCFLTNCFVSNFMLFFEYILTLSLLLNIIYCILIIYETICLFNSVNLCIPLFIYFMALSACLWNVYLLQSRYTARKIGTSRVSVSRNLRFIVTD